MYTTAAPLGFSFNPLHYAKKAVVATGHGVVAVGKETGHLTKKYGVYALAPVLIPMKLIAEPLVKLALRPVKRKVGTLKDRRAKKLAWDRRRSTVPTSAEQNEARTWTKHQVRGEIPFGPVLNALAGPPSFFAPPDEPVVLLGQFGEVVTAATISASVPVMLALMDHILGKHSASGEAPVNPQGGSAGPTTPEAPGAADSTQDAGAAADGTDAGAGADSGGGAGSGGGGGGKGMIKLPGMKITKKQAMIGGAVLGGFVLLVLLMPKRT